MRQVSKKVKSFCLALCLLATGLFTCGLVGVFNANATNEPIVQFVGGELKTQYYYGDTLEIPTGKFTVDGTDYAASVETAFPNGNRNLSNKITLDTCGDYEVVYSATVNGETYRETVAFQVTRPLYEVVGAGTTEFGEHENLGGQTGLITSFALGDVFQYNKTIDLSKMDRTDTLVKFMITPEELGTAEFYILKLKIEDIYDPSNYFIVTMHKVDDGIYGDYVAYTGVSVLDDGLQYYQEKNSSTPSTNSAYGRGLALSFNGTPGVSFTDHIIRHDYYGYDPETHTFSNYANGALAYYYDNEENEIWFKQGDGSYDKILDLDLVGKNWKGFTDGQVKLSLWAEKLQSPRANIVIYDIAGHDLSENVLKDGAPILKVDADEVPNGLVNTPYPVFGASATDLYGGETVEQVRVYYNYYASNRTKVGVENGKFLPKRAGTYTIVYTSESVFSGAVSTKTVDVQVLETAEAINLEIASGVTSGVTGEKIRLAAANYSGGVGELSLTVKVTLGETVYEVTDGYFIPNKAGTYQVAYTATDFLGREKTESYTVQVSYAVTPFFAVANLSGQFLDNYLAGYAYTLANVESYYYDEQGNAVALQTQITVNNGTVANGTFTPATAGAVTFTVSASQGGETVTETFTKNVVNVGTQGSLEIKDLFVGDVTTVWTENNYVQANFTADGSTRFANGLLTEYFNVSFNVDATKNDVSQIRILLTDSQNAEESVAVDILKKSSGAYMQINGTGLQVKTNNDFSGNDRKDFLFSLSGNVAYIGATNLTIGEYVNGEKFNGFTSHKVYLEVQAIGVGAKGLGIIFKDICGQVAKKNASDAIGPRIALLGNYGGLQEINSVIRLPEAYAGDVLAPELQSFTVTVKAGNTVLTSVDGVRLENAPVKAYQVKLTSYGTYRVTYTAVDKNGVGYSTYYLLRVYDFVEPEIDIVGGYSTSVKVGQSYTVANYVVSDNVDGEDDLTVRIYWKDTNGLYHTVKNNTFTPTEKGEIYVYYSVFDSNGNTKTVGYKVTVK